MKVVLEDCDRATVAAAARLGLPPRYEVIVLPGGHPRTKPRALNAGLEAARGDLVVVYDAEDRPHPGQLRAAAARFAAAPGDLGCLQARLTVDHAGETWFTRGIMAQAPPDFRLPNPHMHSVMVAEVCREGGVGRAGVRARAGVGRGGGGDAINRPAGNPPRERH